MKKLTKFIFAIFLVTIAISFGASKASAATLREQLVNEAYRHIGKPYVWGGKGPNSFDCSGLTRYVYLQVTNKDIGGWTVPQESSGTVKSVSEAQPGDLLFWGNRGQSYHVAISIGSGKYIHAPQPGQNVTVGQTSWYTPSFAVDVAGNAGNESSGTVTTNGWNRYGNDWYFYENGAWKKGWLQTGNAWYYLDGSGKMKTGWVNDNGTWYYMRSSGSMATGWVNDNGTWYYMQSNGTMTTGWTSINGTWYYLYGNGSMAVGWINDNGTWYYMRSNGSMAVGWVNDGGIWYCMNSQGTLKTGWMISNGVWYYFNQSGVMVTGNHVIDGVSYQFASSGALNN